MHTQIQLNGKSLRVDLSAAAEQALTHRRAPLLAEMELYFSCLIRKQVRFHEDSAADAVRVNDQLQVRFHPVMSQVCSVKNNLDGPPLTDFPIVRQERFSPRWLTLDFHDGHWQGQFGY